MSFWFETLNFYRTVHNRTMSLQPGQYKMHSTSRWMTEEAILEELRSQCPVVQGKRAKESAERHVLERWAAFRADHSTQMKITAIWDEFGCNLLSETVEYLWTQRTLKRPRSGDDGAQK